MIAISSAGADAAELDDLTRSLLGDLDAVDVDSAERFALGEVPPGAKAVDPLSLGWIVVNFGPKVIATLASVLSSWASRDERRKVTVVIGDKRLELTGATSEEMKLIIERWLSAATSATANT